MSEATEKPKVRRRPIRWLLRQCERCLAVFGFGVLVYYGCFDLVRITSDSMTPTLRGTSWDTGDSVLSERVSGWFRRPRRWEVIALRNPDGAKVMKRVVGLPGEKVQMLRGGAILINGEELPVPAAVSFLRYFPYGNVIEDKAVDCGEGYFVLGDKSRDSDDSRFNGPVPPHRVLGRAWLIVAPASRFGWVNP